MNGEREVQAFDMPVINAEPREHVRFTWTLRRDKRARYNHGQSLERLRARGGLSWMELLLILLDQPLFGRQADKLRGLRDATIRGYVITELERNP